MALSWAIPLWPPAVSWMTTTGTRWWLSATVVMSTSPWTDTLSTSGRTESLTTSIWTMRWEAMCTDMNVKNTDTEWSSPLWNKWRNWPKNIITYTQSMSKHWHRRWQRNMPCTQLYKARSLLKHTLNVFLYKTYQLDIVLITKPPGAKWFNSCHGWVLLFKKNW